MPRSKRAARAAAKAGWETRRAREREALALAAKRSRAAREREARKREARERAAREAERKAREAEAKREARNAKRRREAAKARKAAKLEAQARETRANASEVLSHALEQLEIARMFSPHGLDLVERPGLVTRPDGTKRRSEHWRNGPKYNAWRKAKKLVKEALGVAEFRKLLIEIAASMGLDPVVLQSYLES